jgi:hypothetical protein
VICLEVYRDVLYVMNPQPDDVSQCEMVVVSAADFRKQTEDDFDYVVAGEVFAFFFGVTLFFWFFAKSVGEVVRAVKYF